MLLVLIIVWCNGCCLVVMMRVWNGNVVVCCGLFIRCNRVCRVSVSSWWYSCWVVCIVIVIGSWW